MMETTDSGISIFEIRLRSLMEQYNSNEPEEKRLKSVKDLARALYDSGSIKVKTRMNYNDPQTDRNNAIESIYKKIQRHMENGIIADDSGQYLPAYVRFFNCSSDYLLGLTDVTSKDIEVRLICQKTGLSEKSVTNLIAAAPQPEDDDDDVFSYSQWWSDLLSSEVFERAPMTWFLYLAAIVDRDKTKAKIDAFEKLMQKTDVQDSEYLYVENAKKIAIEKIYPSICSLTKEHLDQLAEMFISFFDQTALEGAKGKSAPFFDEYFKNEIKKWEIWKKQIET